MECQEALQKLKTVLLENALLAHPDFSRPFLLSTDVSMDGLGAVLSQVPKDGDTAKPIAFASKAVNYAQSRYPAHHLEFSAMRWAI